MAVNGKKKGSKAERALCKWWTAWSGLEFNRVPASGGLRWGNTQNITGDLICSDPRASRRFPLSIESKSYKDIRFEHLILGNKNIKIIEFWEQAKEDGVRGNKIPILFMRYNGMSANTWFIIITYRIYKLWVKAGGTHKYPMINIKLSDEQLVLMNSNDFHFANYSEFIISLKKLNRNGQN